MIKRFWNTKFKKIFGKFENIQIKYFSCTKKKPTKVVIMSRVEKISTMIKTKKWLNFLLY